MRRLILTWLGFVGLWVLVHALVSVLDLRHIEITHAATWMAALVPLLQALVAESLAQPFALVARLHRLGALARGRPVAALWIGAALLALGALLLVARPAAILATLAALLATVAAIGLALRSRALGAARPRALVLATVVLLLASQRIAPWLLTGPTRLLPGLPARLAQLLALAVPVVMLFALLFALARELSPPAPESADLLGATAGVAALALLVGGVPVLLGAQLTPRAAGLATFLWAAAATALASAVLALPRKAAAR